MSSRLELNYKMMKSDVIEKDAQQEQVDSSLLVVNLRGTVNTRSPVRKAMEQLHVIKRFNATIVPKNKVNLGMLNLCKEHLAWSVVDSKTIEQLLTSRAEVSDGRKFSSSSSLSELADSVSKGKSRLDGSQGFRQFFRLSPPRGGFKRSIRRQFGEGGILGPNPELPKLIEKMMP